MWIHGVWFLVALLTAWTAERMGEAIASGRADQELDDQQAQIDRLRTELDTAHRRIARWKEVGVHWKSQWRHQWTQNQRLVDRLLPPPAIDDVAGDPPTVAQADRAAFEAAREAQAREDAEWIAAQDLADREPVPISDDEVMPVPRLTDTVGGEDDDGGS